MLLSTKILTIGEIKNTFLSSILTSLLKVHCETTVPPIKPNHKETMKSKTQQ